MLKKEILIGFIYILISLLIYTQINMIDYGEYFKLLNMFGIGIWVSSLLILFIEDITKRMFNSGRLSNVNIKDIKKTNYGKYTFIFGFSSLLLEIFRNIL